MHVAITELAEAPAQPSYHSQGGPVKVDCSGFSSRLGDAALSLNVTFVDRVGCLAVT